MRILIVEDSPELAKLIARYVSGMAREVIIAESMAEADAIIHRADPFDLVTLDLNLPDSRIEDTIAKIKDIKKTNPNGLLVVITGVVRPEDQARVKEGGADGYIYKVDIMGKPATFLNTLADIARSLIANPTRYTKNVALLETRSAALAAGFEEQSITA